MLLLSSHCFIHPSIHHQRTGSQGVTGLLLIFSNIRKGEEKRDDERKGKYRTRGEEEIE